MPSYDRAVSLFGEIYAYFANNVMLAKLHKSAVFMKFKR